MLADDNPYAAPQTALTQVTPALANANNRVRFQWALVRQSLRNGAVAGLVASLVMMFVYLLRTDNESGSDVAQLLGVCVWFIIATASLGLFWGFNHALIVWVLQRWRPDSWMNN